MNRKTAVLLVAATCLCLPTEASEENEKARKILEATGVKGGLVVHVGCGDGKLTAALGSGEAYLVHGLDGDAENVQQARAHVRSQNLTGRVLIERWPHERLPYADRLVNLLVSEDLGKIPMAEVMRVLAPRGVAYLKREGAWTSSVKPWPDEMDEWTHFRYAAHGNMVSKDALAGPPRYVQWISGPLFQRHHAMVPSITSLVSAKGRAFTLIDLAPTGFVGMPDQWYLVARDAFNGVLLWKRPVKDWGSAAWSYWTVGHSARFNHPIHVRKRLVAEGDRVYVTLGFNEPVSALDAATGKTLLTYEGTQYADEFVILDGKLYISVNDRLQKPWPGKGILPQPTEIGEDSKKRILAVDAATGKELWKSEPFTGKQAKPDRLGSMKHLTLTACEKGVFIVDDKSVVCLDLETGQERWRVPRLSVPEPEGKKRPPDLGKYYHNMNRVDMQNVVYYQGVLLVLHSAGHSGFKWESPSLLQALSPDTGKELWRYGAAPINYLDVPDVLGAAGLVWLPDRKSMTCIGLDPATGKKKRTLSIEKAMKVGHHHRCYPNRATENHLILGRRGAEFVDLASGEITLHHWARSGCRYGHMIANGLFYRTPDFCRCYMVSQPRGFYAMASEKGVGEFKSRLSEENPFEKGPAFGKAEDAPAVSYEGEWPTYRHDPMRSGSVKLDVPPALQPAWQADLGGDPTPPVIAGGRVYCSSGKSRRVCVFDAATGKALWSYEAGGRVDSPPTIHKGTAIFGSADGWVTCLRASDGELVWRFRAAPGERKIVAFGRVESAWPVHGSVLVVGDTVYTVAGRSSLLDGGMVAYALDAKTGKVLERKGILEVQTDTKTTGKLPEGPLSDILVFDGESVCLRASKLGFEAPRPIPGEAFEGLQTHLVADGGFFDTHWFHRAFWSLRAGRARVQGNLIVFNAGHLYAAAANKPGKNNQSFYIPEGGQPDRVIGRGGVKGPSWLTNINLQHGGFFLSSKRLMPDKQARKPGERGSAWSTDKFPVCPWTMVVAGKTLFVAGFPARIDPEDPWATIEGRRGGVLCALSAESGEKLAEHKLKAPPVWNGMAAAGGRLYLSTRDGRLICLEGKESR